MFPYKTSLQIDRKSKQPLYLQLSNQLIQLVAERKLTPKTKLPSSRFLAELIGVHRKTIVACYEELFLQGWVESIPKKGTFVNANLPELAIQNYTDYQQKRAKNTTDFSFYKDDLLARENITFLEDMMYIDDGISDARLTPTEDLARIYRRICSKKNIHKEMSYGTTFGNLKLRKTLANYLNKTRGLQVNEHQILVTRGSQMGIYLASKLLLTNNDVIVVGETNYIAADTSFLAQKATLIRIKVDENGLVTDELEKICKQQKVKAVYVTSHHHHTTTVTLSAERRIHLLNLAKQYKFAIIEDDYD